MSAEKAARIRAIQFGSRYHLVRPLTTGTYGYVCIGRDTETGEGVAFKIEPRSAGVQFVPKEVEIYQILDGEVGFPRVYWYEECGDFRIMVMDLLGPDLLKTFSQCGGRFSLKTVLMIADQVLARLEVLHRKGYIHLDVKPENLLLGKGVNRNTIHLADLGLAEYRVDDQLHGLRPTDIKVLTGSAQYASIHAHYLHRSQKSDDLESLAYMMIYLIWGFLPWQGIENDCETVKSEGMSKSEVLAAGHVRVLEMKQAFKDHPLWKDLPRAFTLYLEYVWRLQHRTPDYAYLSGLLHDLFDQEGYEWDGVYDWDLAEGNHGVDDAGSMKRIDHRGCAQDAEMGSLSE